MVAAFGLVAVAACQLFYFNAVSRKDAKQASKVMRTWVLLTGLICGGGILIIALSSRKNVLQAASRIAVGTSPTKLRRSRACF